MKRLIKKSLLLGPPDVRDEVYLNEDSNYEGLDMNALSLPKNRDGIVLVDIKEHVAHWGLNGETHAELMEKYYSIDKNSNDTKLDIDSYVCSGIYLKNFLGAESVIFYSYLSGAEEIVQNDKPGIIVYEEQYFEETLLRIANKRLKSSSKSR